MSPFELKMAVRENLYELLKYSGGTALTVYALSGVKDSQSCALVADVLVKLGCLEGGWTPSGKKYISGSINKEKIQEAINKSAWEEI